jgi:RNA polymerase sigma factor (sigma-70 family)
MNATPFEQQNRETFFSQIRRQLKGLYRFVRHQLAYFESVGDLLPGELTAEDVVDAVLLQAYRDFVKKPAEGDMKAWLMELAQERLVSEMKRSKAARERTVHIEEDIPETAPEEEVSTLGDEILDFYQPDEDLKLEDVLPDVEVSTPEEIAAAKEELLKCVNAALAGMPKEWRRALRLRHREGLTEEDVAEALQRARPEIARILEYARQHLRQSLIESGCTFIVKGNESHSRSGRERRPTPNSKPPESAAGTPLAAFAGARGKQKPLTVMKGRKENA